MKYRFTALFDGIFMPVYVICGKSIIPPGQRGSKHPEWERLASNTDFRISTYRQDCHTNKEGGKE
jgi:hypothetical protein